MPPASRRRFCTFSFRRLFLFLWTKWAEPNRTEQQLRSGIGSQTPPPKHGPNQNAIERKDEVEERRERRRENKRCQREGSRTRRWLPVEKASISDQVHARPSDALPMKPDVQSSCNLLFSKKKYQNSLSLYFSSSDVALTIPLTHWHQTGG